MIEIILAVSLVTTRQYQLGACDDAWRPVCKAIGQPQPLEICSAMRDAMRKEGLRRVVCAPVLVDEVM